VAVSWKEILEIEVGLDGGPLGLSQKRDGLQVPIFETPLAAVNAWVRRITEYPAPAVPRLADRRWVA